MPALGAPSYLSDDMALIVEGNVPVKPPVLMPLVPSPADWLLTSRETSAVSAVVISVGKLPPTEFDLNERNVSEVRVMMTAGNEPVKAFELRSRYLHHPRTTRCSLQPKEENDAPVSQAVVITTGKDAFGRQQGYRYRRDGPGQVTPLRQVASSGCE